VTDLITGAAGFIGSHLAARLLDDGREVVGVDCFTDYYDPARKRRNVAPLQDRPGFRLVEADLATDDLAGVVNGVERVYHLAAQPGVRGSWGDGFATYIRQNIAATQRLLEALRGTGSRVVYASSSSIYGEAEGAKTTEDTLPRPVSPYGVTKLSGEQLVMAYVRAAGLDARAVRYFTVYGPRQRPDMAFSRFIAAAQRGDPVDVYGDGNQTRDFTFVADAVEATMLAGTVDDPAERIFNVGGGSTTSVREVLELLGTILGRPVEVRRQPEQPGDVRHTGADLERTRRVLGWRPRVAIADGLAAQVDATRPTS
jgi:UDP-glucuronate 4-epimerase